MLDGPCRNGRSGTHRINGKSSAGNQLRMIASWQGESLVPALCIQQLHEQGTHCTLLTAPAIEQPINTLIKADHEPSVATQTRANTMTELSSGPRSLDADEGSGLLHSGKEYLAKSIRHFLGRVLALGGVPAVRPVQHSEDGVGSQASWDVIPEAALSHPLLDQG